MNEKPKRHQGFINLTIFHLGHASSRSATIKRLTAILVLRLELQKRGLYRLTLGGGCATMHIASINVKTMLSARFWETSHIRSRTIWVFTSIWHIQGMKRVEGIDEKSNQKSKLYFKELERLIFLRPPQHLKKFTKFSVGLIQRYR